MRSRSRAFHCHGGFPSTPIWQRSGSSPAASASGGSEGEPGLVALCCNGVPSGGGGALFLRHSRTAFTGVPIGTDWKGAASMFVLAVLYCSCFMVTLAPRFVEKEKLQNRKRGRSHKRNKNRSRGKRSNNANTHITPTLSLSSFEKSTTSSSKPFSKTLPLTIERKLQQVRLQTTAPQSLFPRLTLLFF